MEDRKIAYSEVEFIMLGQNVANLLIPGDPTLITLKLPSSTWTLERHPNYDRHKKAIEEYKCAETYFLSTNVPRSNSAVFDIAFDELTPIFLGSSYATGLTVTSIRSMPMSEAPLLQRLDYWPRDRAMDMPSFVVNSDAEFVDLVEKFVHSWNTLGKDEKALLLVHHWLDSIVCWSMEDMYLSATTLLQVIVATEASKQNKQELPFYAGIEAAANRFGLNVLSADFKNMRNELIHDGQLIGRRFAGPDKDACAEVISEVLKWLDSYIHASLSLGAVRRIRFRKADLINLNAYSIS